MWETTSLTWILDVKQMSQVLRLLLLLFTLVLVPDARAMARQDRVVGILAPRGPEIASAEWQPWLDWLENQLPGQHLTLAPLTLAQLRDPTVLHRLDFLLANPLQFVLLNKDAQLRWIAAVKPSQPVPGEKTLQQIGTAIWVRKSSDLHTIASLKGKRMAGVAEYALGGYLLAYKQLRDAGLRPGHDVELVFTGFPVDQTLALLAQGRVDAAVAPLCVMEDMQAQGLLPADAFRALDDVSSGGQCAGAVSALPGWSLAALPSTPSDLAEKISRLLLSEPVGAGLPSWTLPVSSSRVDNFLRSIDMHPYQPSLWRLAADWSLLHWRWLLVLACLPIVLLINQIWLARTAHKQNLRLKQAYRKLRKYEQALAHGERINLMGEMASGIAHEVNQPLSAILHYSEAGAYQLKQSSPGHTLIPVFERINQEVGRCAQAVKNLRAWASPAAVQARERIKLAASVEEIVDVVTLQSDMHRDAVKINMEAGLAVWLVPGVLDQVVRNCLMNAIQAGAQRITLRARKNEDDVLLSIEDDGKGFGQDQLDFPFVPFRSERPDGLGLGLAICERLLRASGGRISLANRPAGEPGAVVTLVLPVGEPDDPTARPDPGATNSPLGAQTGGHDD